MTRTGALGGGMSAVYAQSTELVWILDFKQILLLLLLLYVGEMTPPCETIVLN